MGASQSATHHEKKESPLKLIWEAKIKNSMCVAHSRDGRTLAVGMGSVGDNVVHLVDVASGQVLKTMRGHTGTVDSVAFSPDGLLVASASRDRTVVLWDATTGEQVRGINGHMGSVYTMAFSPDGQTLVTGSNDHTVSVWRVKTGGVKAWLDRHTDNVVDVAVSPDGLMIASASCDKTVGLWELATGVQRAVLRKHAKRVRYVVFSHDGTVLATGDHEGNVVLWDARSGAQMHTMEGYRGTSQYHDKDHLLALAFSPDGRTLVGCKYNVDDFCGSVVRWSTVTGRRSGAVWGGIEWWPSDKLSFSPDGTQLAVVSFVSSNVRLFRTTGMWEE